MLILKKHINYGCLISNYSVVHTCLNVKSGNAPLYVFSVPFIKFKITSDFLILEKQIVFI